MQDHEGKDIFPSCLQLYPDCLQPGLVHSRCAKKYLFNKQNSIWQIGNGVIEMLNNLPYSLGLECKLNEQL